MGKPPCPSHEVPQCLSEGIDVWKPSRDGRSDDLSWWFHTFQKVLSESNFEHPFTVVQSLTDDPLSHSAPWVAAGFCPMRAQGQCWLNEQETHPMRELRHYPTAKESWRCCIWVNEFMKLLFLLRHAGPGRERDSQLISGRDPAHCGAAITQHWGTLSQPVHLICASSWLLFVTVQYHLSALRVVRTRPRWHKMKPTVPVSRQIQSLFSSF